MVIVYDNNNNNILLLWYGQNDVIANTEVDLLMEELSANHALLGEQAKTTISVLKQMLDQREEV